MSLNSYLLSKLTTNFHKGTDVYALAKRYQALWIIYTNFITIIALFVWKLLNMYTYPSAECQAGLLTIPWVLVSMVLLKRNRTNLAAVFALFSIHTSNFTASYHASIASAHFEILLPGLGFLLSPNQNVHIVNVVCCLLQNIRHMYRMEQKFKVTFTDDQQLEIFQLHLISFITLITITTLFYVQNIVKTKLWQLAQSNYIKTEEIAKELFQATKSKDTFISSLSHEIRNPLNCMNGSIDFLLQVVKDPSHLHLLNNAKISCEVLLNLLTNVLDAAKLKSEKMELSYAEVRPIDAVKKLLIIYNESLREKQITVNVHINKCLPPLMWLDPSRLLQIIINLFSNALKFTPEKGKIQLYLTWCHHDTTKESLLASIDKSWINEPPEDHNAPRSVADRITSSQSKPEQDDESFSFQEFSQLDDTRVNNFQYLDKARITASRSSSVNDIKDDPANPQFISYTIGDQVTQELLQNICSGSLKSCCVDEGMKGYLKVQISDTGCGVNQENVPKLFEMFSQADNAVGSIHGGSGLGLWICKQLCSKMGGDITLYSAVDKGTTCVFYLPVNNRCLISNAMLQSRQSQDEIRALVVDDYAYNRDVHKLILERENVKVVLAGDGQQALEIFTAHEEGYFQFIMMDVMMPVMDGFTAAKKIREWEKEKKRKRVDIYFVSGEYYDEEEVLREITREGKVGIEGIKCLKKPIGVDQIKKVLKTLYRSTV